MMITSGRMNNNSSDSVRLALVGCGAIAESMHIPAALAVDRVQLVALVDADRQRAETLAKRHGIPGFSANLQDFVGRVDAVVLCTPPQVRPILAQQAFDMGLHVLAEKPLANTVSECDQIIQAAERANRTLAVAHIFRFWPSRQAIHAIIAGREFGAIKSATVTQGNPYGWSTVTGYNMRPDMVPGGVLFDAGMHPLDTILWWFGDPEIVDYQDDSLGGLESNMRLTMSFADVPEVRFRQSRTAPMSNSFQIQAESATITLSNYSPTTIDICQDGKVIPRQVAGTEVDHRVCECNQLLDFAESTAESRPPAVTGHDARRVIDLVERCYAARKACEIPKNAPIPGLTF